MALASTVLSAVEKLKLAIGDLGVEMTLTKRTKDTYVPGQSVTYTEASHTAKGVISKFKVEEVDGQMIQKQDLLILLFPPESKAIPETNDSLANGSKTYRVMDNTPLYAGSEIALNVIHVRPL